MFEYNKTVQKALALAEKAHAGQVRKFTGTPYVEHPKRVAQIVRDLYAEFDAAAPTPLVAAALLHDVLEDTDTPIEEIVAVGIDEDQGREILGLVLNLTDDKSLKGSRKWRKEASLMRLASAGLEVALIKFADRLDNVGDMSKQNPDFFKKKYASESIRLVEVLEAANAIQVKMLQHLGDQIREVVETGLKTKKG